MGAILPYQMSLVIIQNGHGVNRVNKTQEQTAFEVTDVT